MTTKKKRVEVVSANLKCFGKKIEFYEILKFINGNKHNGEFKDYEVKLLPTNLENCSVGIIITGQNKDLPPKRNNQTGIFSTLDLDINEEKLSFGNIFIYDKKLNILFYELNMNGCYLDKLSSWIEEHWNACYEDKIELSFISVSRKGEYQRLLDMGYYKEFYAELTNPTEILQDYKDNHSSIFEMAKRYIHDGVKNNSDTIIIKYATFGKKNNKTGLSGKALIKLVDSFRFLLVGEQKKNVKKLKVKGYFTDPNDGKSIQPINLVSDVFNIFIKLTTKTLLSDLQETERQSEIEELYKNHLKELNFIFNRNNNEIH